MFICPLHSVLWGEKETSQKKSAEVVIMLGETLLSFIFGIMQNSSTSCRGVHLHSVG